MVPQPNPDVDVSLAVVAGGFALLGVAVGHLLTMLSSWLDRKRQRNQLLLTKLDELTTANCQTREWLNTIQNHSSTLEQLRVLPPSIFCCRMEALIVLYFPRLRPPVTAYMAELKSYYSWALHSVRDDSQQPIGAQLHVLDKDHFLNSMTKIQEAQQALGSALEHEARIHLNRS